jgi:ABC-type multidrug transport system ATPase subunit
VAYLEIRNISKSHGPIRAVQEMSFEVERGEIFALFGPDGAGKTTLIRVLCHVMDADSGEALLDGREMFRDFEPVKKLLGYMPQSFSLYLDLSVEENLTFYSGIYGLVGEAYRKKRDALYAFSNLAPFSDRRAGALSGGMKQKLALSCALIHNPTLLILDEPTTGVDPLSRRQFWEMLLELKQQGVTVLVTTPYMDEVIRADRAAFMFAGQKLSEGTPQALAAQFRGNIYLLEEMLPSESWRQLEAIPGLMPRRFGAGLHIHFKEGITIEQVQPRLREIGLDPTRLVRITPQLEDRFIQLMETRS